MTEENRILTRIDCHAHYLPDAYRQAGRDAFPEGADGFPLRALMDIADPKKVLYGSDWPFTPAPAARQLADALDTTDLIGPDWRRQIYRDNALRLLPSLSRRLE